MLVAAGVVLFIAPAGRGICADAGIAPNIVVILADDLGYSDVVCYGASKVHTPNVDRLAREGMRFSDAHSPCSVCTPSRYNTLTGRYCWRTWAKTGCVWANDPLLIDDGRMTIASLLKQAGYVTGCVGKWHQGFGRPGTPGWDDLLGPDFNGELRPGPCEVGFDYFFGMPAIFQHPNVFIENHRVVDIKPGDPIRLKPDLRRQFQTDYLHRPRTENINLQMASGKSAEYDFTQGAIRLTAKAVSFIEDHRQQRFFLHFPMRNIHEPLAPNPRFAGTSQAGTYGDFIQELDWCVGEVLGTLDRLKLTDSTLVIFSSDNGGTALCLGGKNGPLRGYKTEVLEGGHRIPFIVRWPGHVKPGSESAQLAANTDLLATFAAVAGQTLPRDAAEDSFSILPVLLGQPDAPGLRQTLVNDSYLGLYSIREGAWKLILGQGGGGIKKLPTRPITADDPPGQLYNLSADLGETNNIYRQHPDIVARLTGLFEQIRTRGRSRP